MTKKHQAYYMVIPATVWAADISPNAKLLYGHITVLSNQKGYAFASNEHFAQLLGAKIPSVKKWLSQLEELDVISRSVYRNQSNAYERKIYINGSIPKDTSSIPQDTTLVSHEIQPSIPTDTNNNKSNNTSINTIDDVKGKIFFKIVDMYPPNRIGNRQHGLKKFKELDIEQCKLAAKNLNRYLDLAGGYVKSLQNYIQEECYTERWLGAETKNKTQKQSIKNDTKTISNDF